MKPSSSMYWTMRPISSRCPSSMIVGDPLGFTSAIQLPATSVLTCLVKRAASSRQMRPATASYPDGPGVSSKRLRKSIEDEFNMLVQRGVERIDRRGGHESSERTKRSNYRKRKASGSGRLRRQWLPQMPRNLDGRRVPVVGDRDERLP